MRYEVGIVARWMDARMRVVDVAYTADGAEVPARMYLPDHLSSPAPAVLLCAGRLREIEGLEFLAFACLRLGMAVLACPYRGMDMRTDDVDCMAGLDFLGTQEDVDADRMLMVGHSRGAMASLRVAAQDERVRAVVALQPVTDFVRYVEATRDYAPIRYGHLIQSLGATPEEDRSRYEALSALPRAVDIKIPVLLVAGTMDLHSPADHSVWMHRALVTAGNADTHLEILDGVGHFFEHMYGGYVQEQITELVTAWLRSRITNTVTHSSTQEAT
ncbi:MAG: alpha/beta hydrolase family protein [Acidimicrobiales bacterium]